MTKYKTDFLLEVVGSNYFTSPGIGNGAEVVTDKVYDAMDQYAKQQCIELLNWMFAGAAETISYPGPNMWLRDLACEYKDSAALLEAFLTEQSI